MTPLEKVEALFDELVDHYGGAADREVRAAAKLLIVAISRLQASDPNRWVALVEEYLALAKDDPDRFERIVRANRSTRDATLKA
jgi:hypothetical protein